MCHGFVREKLYIMHLNRIIRQCIFFGGMISMCAANGEQQLKGNIASTTSSLKKTRPIIKDLRCIDRDFQRTLKWTVDDVTENLRLENFNLRFNPATRRKKNNLRCFEDESRTKRLKTVKKTECKTNVSQFLDFTYNYFHVQGIYIDLSTNVTVKSKQATVACVPLDAQTNLSAPSIRVLAANKTTLHAAMSLPDLLQKTLNANLHSPPDVYYHFCIFEQGKHCNLNANSTQQMFGLTSAQKFVGLTPGTSYDVLGWYTLSDEDADLKSEEIKITARTDSDPFPSWAQILTVALACGVLILSLLCIAVGRMSYKAWLRVEAETHKRFPPFLEEALAEARSYENFPENPTVDDLLSNWLILQGKRYEVFDIPPIQTKSSGRKIEDRDVDEHPSLTARVADTLCARKHSQELSSRDEQLQMQISAIPFNSKSLHSRRQTDGSESHSLLDDSTVMADYVKVVKEDTCLIPGEYVPHGSSTNGDCAPYSQR